MSFASFFAALSGLQANASRLSVIGNNLANVNTIGFKTSRVTFQDFFTGAQFNGAGNPAQVGRGTNLASIDPVFSQGSLQTTSQLTDLAIQGRGFFILANDNGGQSYTRAGNFTFDNNGDLVSASGHYVQGFTQLDANGHVISSGSLSNIRIPSGLTAPPQPTTQFQANINLDASLSEDFSATISVFDSLGDRHNVNISFTPTDTNADTIPDAWTYSVTVPGEEVAGGTPGTPTVIATGTIDFDTTGQLTTPAADVTLSLPAWANGAAAQSVVWELFDQNGDGRLTGYADASAMSSSGQDGFSVGQIRTLLIDQEGLVSGIFTNGVNIELARLAMATFNNEGGLLRSGGNRLNETNSSGTPTIGAPNTGGRGATISSSLELSNVDITEEFTDLIISQRGYQSNSRVITTTDEVIQEALNLKR
jgi:flagellar hook protein FlgE